MCMHVCTLPAQQLIIIKQARVLRLEKIRFVSWLATPFNSCAVVIVCSDCCNKTPQSGWLINKQEPHVFFTVLEAGVPRSVSQHGQMRAHFRVTDFLFCHYMAELAKELYSGLFFL